MPSKMITDRVKLSEQLQEALRTLGPKVTAVLDNRWTPLLEDGGALPDLEGAFRLMRLELKAATEALVAADEAHERELADDPEARQERDLAADKANDVFIVIRKGLRAIYGEIGAVSIMGFSGDTSSDPLVLAQQLRQALAGLRQPEEQLPAPVLPDLQANLGGLAQRLEDVLAPLEDALARLVREYQESDASQARKDQALTAFNQAYPRTRNLLEGFLSLAGMEDEASRLPASRPGSGSSSPREEVSEGVDIR